LYSAIKSEDTEAHELAKCTNDLPNIADLKRDLRAALGPNLHKKNLRKNPKFSVSFSSVYVKFIESYKVKIFTEF